MKSTMFTFKDNGSPSSSSSSVSQTMDDDVKLAADLASAGQESTSDARTMKRARQKIDAFLIPTLILGYGLTYYDKAILGQASLFGMLQDLDLQVVVSTNPPVVSTQRLSWATSLFYFGMLLGLYPMTLLIQRFRISYVMGPLIIIWGMIAMCTAACTSWQGLYVQRFFLGVVEAAIPTSYMIIISNFYTQQEQALRQSLWFSAVCIFTIIGGGLNWGFAHIKGGSLKSWQYIYLLAGAITVLFGIFCFAIPDSPSSAWFLKPAERIAALERLRHDQTGVRNHQIKLKQAIACFKDPKFALYFILMASAYVSNGAVTGFGPLIVRTFGWSTLDSILFQFPLSGLGCFGIIFSGWLSSKKRGLISIQMALWCIPVIVGCAMCWRCAWTYRAAAPMVGFTLIGGFAPVVSLIIVSSTSNVAGATKKSMMSATVFVAYCVGNIVGPQLVKTQQKSRHYPELFLGVIICYCIVIVFSGILYAYLWMQNKKKIANQPLDEKFETETAFQDLTDTENPNFRYAL